MKFKLILILSIFIILSSFASAITLNDAELWITFDDADLSASNPTDVSGNNYNLYNRGATTGQTGKINEGFSFDEVTSDKIKTENYDWNFNTDFTMGCWVYPTDTIETRMVFRPTDNDDSDRLQAGINVDNTITYYLASGSAWDSPLTTTGAVTDNAWNLLIIGRSGNTKYVFINNNAGESGATNKNPVNTKLSFGDYLTQNSTIAYDGTLDECFVYNRFLNSSERTAIYTATQNPYVALSANFTITARSEYNNSNTLTNFSALINGTIYSTTNGTIITPYNQSQGLIFNITLSSTNWFNTTYNLYNISSNLAGSLNQSIISFGCYQKITNNVLTCVNGTINQDANTYNFTVGVNGYYNVTQEETINALDNKTISFNGFYNSNLTFSNNFITGPGNETLVCNYTITGITYPSYSENVIGPNSSSVGLINGTYNITADCPDYAYSYETIIINDTTESVTFDLYTTNSIDISIFDETTGASLNGTNITVTKILGAVQEVNITSTGTISYSELTAGNYTFNFEGDDYPQRSYSVSIGNKTYQTLNVYLLANTTDKVIFAFEEYNSNQVIEGITLQISKVINGTDTLIAVLTSDITGRTQFYFDTTERYCFIATKTSYTTKTWCLDPIIFTSYTIKLQTSVSLETGDDYEEILIDWTPKQFWNNVNNTIIFTFANPRGSLTNYGFNATLDNGTSVSASGTNAYGEVINKVLPIANSQYGDKVTLYYYYKKSGDAEYRTFKLIYNIYGYNATTDSLLDNPPEDYGLGEFEKTLISVGITVLVGGAGAYFGGALAGGVMALFMFVWLIYIAFLNFWVGIISIILLFIIISWRSTQ